MEKNKEDSDSESSFELSDSDEEKLKKSKTSWYFKQKKALASKASTSTIGKALLTKFASDETLTLLKAVKTIIAKEAGPKKAHAVKKDIIKIAVKVILLYEDKYVTEESFNSLQYSFRRICSAIKQGYSTDTMDKRRIERINKLIVQFDTGLKSILKPHISENTVKRITTVTSYLGSIDFITKAVKYPEFDRVVYVLAYYLEM
eukprot:TRINITY_DN15880_c0_g1_i1.p1 TRINITY_DN15880_c0_g1~~TRINITY_DN15880_c0_g1_i1.p1  ORF type:complete len:237 (+),score=44.52 TRINITY_DN15880_c0_g1_i1:103-711(+)